MNREKYIRLISGSLVLISLALGVYVNRYWLFFTAFVGLNLVQSVFTNFCLMDIILKKLGVKSAAERALEEKKDT